MNEEMNESSGTSESLKRSSDFERIDPFPYWPGMEPVS